MPMAPTWPVVPQGHLIESLETTKIAQRFKDVAPTLFCKGEEDMIVEIGSLSQDGVTVDTYESERGLEDGLEREQAESESPGVQDELKASEPRSRNQMRFIFLNPTYGWGKLGITTDAMSYLLLKLGVFSKFFKYLTAFGMKTFARDEGYGGFDWRLSKNKDFESCYLLKYVDKKENPGTSRNPWSIRQTLIYQKSSVKTSQDTFLFVRLSELLGEHFSTLLSTDDTKPPHWTQIQGLCFSSIIDNWREYINWLEGEISLLFDRVIIASVEVSQLTVADSIATSHLDMKRLQYLTDQLSRTSHMLDLNIQVLSRLLKLSQTIAPLEHPSTSTHYTAFETVLNETSLEQTMLKHNVEGILKRAKLLAEQLRDTISLRNSEINKVIDTNTSDGTKAMVKISERSEREANVVKVLTVIALIFVPFSFASDVMQMGYIDVTNDGPFTVSADRGLLFWAIIAIPLILATMLTIYFVPKWLVWRDGRRERRARRHGYGDEEWQDDTEEDEKV